jgi:hypothetical protein
VGDKEEKREKETPCLSRTDNSPQGNKEGIVQEVLSCCHMLAQILPRVQTIVQMVVTGQPPPTTATAATVILYI